MTRVAVVTGAASGIGAATAGVLDAEGWEVVGIDVRQAPAETPCSSWHQLDVSDADALEAAFSRVPRVDGLVNNAALQHAHSLQDTTTVQWDAVMAVNVRAPFQAIRLCADRLAEVGGAVVNVSSVHALATSVDVAAYAASKAALLGLTRAAAMELGPLGVRVNALAPGAVDTAALRAATARGVTDELRDRTPLRRFGEPAEIGRAIGFLLDGERSGFITGETLVVDGGAIARLATE